MRRPVPYVVLAGLLARALVAALVPLTTDEAYYVDWARHLAPGYLDHPPLVAWLIAGPLAAFGHHTLAVRLPALLLQAATTLLAASLARALAGEAAALVTAVLFQAAPVFAVGGLLVTPDAPLAFAWAGALWAVERAGSRDARWWLAVGVFVGVGALAKLHAGLLGLALAAALLATPDGRRALRTAWPWAGAAAALLVAAPFLLWNARHGWATFAFQAAHGLRGRSFSVGRLAASLAGQAAYVSPVLFALAAAAAWRALRGVRRPAPPPEGARGAPVGAAGGLACTALASTALPLAAFFTLSAAFTPGALPHWTAPAWLSACVLLAVGAAPRGAPAAAPDAGGAARAWGLDAVGALPRPLRAGLLVGGAMTALLLAALPVAPRFVGGPLDELRGWEEAVVEARRIAPGARLATTHWMALGHLGWYAQEPLAYVSDRMAGPSFYAPLPRRRDRPVLIVAPDRLAPPRERLEELVGAPLRERGRFTARAGERAVRSYAFYELDPGDPL
jgi:4-amino-4-deoxy-L-arabinose transferase-like glycosyltransferase